MSVLMRQVVVVSLLAVPFEGVSVEDLLQRADAAMYQSKRYGKNKATLSPHL
jgi:PleD family two-component response regulator